MRLSLLVPILVIALLGCNGSTPATKPGVVGESKSDEKTVEDSRKYMQEQIDRYLGGQRTQEQLMKITLDVKPGFQIIKNGPIQSITITNILPWYSEKGERQKNGFVLSLAFSGAGWNENVPVHMTYHDDGKWTAF
jgi:hypothetical protein